MRTWDPEAVKAALDTERAVHGEDFSPEKISRRKFRDSVALAADRIIHIALYSENETLAFRASTYITDSVLGRVSDRVPLGKTDLFDELFRDVLMRN